MTAAVVHVWRLLTWGRVLARHGALRGIERDSNTPPAVRRLCRLARFGARVPDVPDYAAAFQAVGPAAIKLGQALATRPDLVGEAAAHDLALLQDSLPPPRSSRSGRRSSRASGDRSRAPSPRSIRSRWAPPRSRRSTAP